MPTINAANLSSPELSIIIISFNTAKITQHCIESIYKSFPQEKYNTFEIILIDNYSHDNSVEIIKEMQKKFSNIKLIANKENTGFGLANNQGVKAAQGKYILLLNSDTIVLDNAIQKMLEYYKQNEFNAHFVGAKLFNKDNTPQPSAAPFYTPAVVFGALFMKGDYWGLTRYSPDHIKRVDWVSGACIMTTKEIYNNVNGFDTDIFMYMEEVDLLYRAKQKGYNTFFYPLAQFIHLGSASSGGKTYPILQVYKGFLFFYKKHYSGIYMLLLKSMLQLKAVISIIIGKLTGNKYLITTYEKALTIASMG